MIADTGAGASSDEHEIRALHKRMLDAWGATEQPYGVRDCGFRDPVGNPIRIQGLP